MSPSCSCHRVALQFTYAPAPDGADEADESLLQEQQVVDISDTFLMNESSSSSPSMMYKTIWAFTNRLLTELIQHVDSSSSHGGRNQLTQSAVDGALMKAHHAITDEKEVNQEEGANDDEVARAWLEEQPEDSDCEDDKQTEKNKKRKVAKTQNTRKKIK
ncbi:hypothetical protein PPROV_000608100 [Pycnococcus provasolii]|uniref:Uncharacterized protein n=2 Tax=Pycnococcus provasolii TaxID=41880 RepID=A0A830HNH7_9CHLO|nr:hypothetical protein PPROV_000608100 [Pycnococcus provasolii]